MISMLFTDR